MKKILMICRHCKEETIHRVRIRSYKSHSKTSGSGIKYKVEHCTKCNKRWYDGKLKGIILKKKKKKFVSFR